MTQYWREEEVEYEDYEDDRDEDGVPWDFGYQTNPFILKFAATCPECDFTSRDVGLLNNHSCDVQQNGGRCEDYPCCGHESGDCNGLRYGSDEAIKADVWRAAHDPEFAYRMELQAEYDEQWGY